MCIRDSHRLIRQNIVNNIKAAKKLIQKADDEVMQVLQEVIEGHPILLNRAPNPASFRNSSF